MKEIVLALIRARRRYRVAEYVVAVLRLEAARARKAKDPDLARYLGALADTFERVP